MTDGEVSVSVRAEGVEDAAGELDPDAAAATGGGDSGGGLAETAANTGRMVKLLAVLGAIFAVFNDVLEIFAMVSAILQGFVAPLAIMLMRLLQPVLSTMLTELLPAWLSFMDENGDLLVDLIRVTSPLLLLAPAFIQFAADAIRWLGDVVEWLKKVTDIDDTVGDVAAGIRDLPSRIWSFMERLPGLIGSAVSNALPDLPGTGGARRTTQRAADRVDEATGGRLSDARDTIVNIGGGLTPFVDSITQSGSIDFP